MTAKKKVVFDMDNVLVDLLGHLLLCIRVKYGVEVSYSDVTDWSVHRAAPIKAAGLTPTQVYDDFFNDPDFWDMIPAMHGLQAFLADVKLRPVDWYIVTSPSNGLSAQCKYDWITRILGADVAKNHLIIGSAKEAVAGDMIVDDRDDNVVRYLDTWHLARALVPLYPYVDKSKLMRFGTRVTYIQDPTVGAQSTSGPVMFLQILQALDELTAKISPRAVVAIGTALALPVMP